MMIEIAVDLRSMIVNKSTIVRTSWWLIFVFFFRNMKREGRIHNEMSSFPETKAEKMMLSNVDNMQMVLW